MSSNRYSRNRIYLNEQEQALIKNYKVLLGGAGIGSIIAECALRFGFESITIVDGDTVEESNLNRQNYLQSDIGRYKCEALADRLKAINPNASIQVINSFIDERNVKEIIDGHHIAINALDFKSDIPFVFDNICRESNIPVLHPYNFGWGGFLTIVGPTGFPMTELSTESNNFELRVVEHVLKYSKFWDLPVEWLEEIITKYKAEKETLPPPQLAIGSWITAGFCVNAMYDIAIGKEVRYFPKFYFASAENGAY